MHIQLISRTKKTNQLNALSDKSGLRMNSKWWSCVDYRINRNLNVKAVTVIDFTPANEVLLTTPPEFHRLSKQTNYISFTATVSKLNTPSDKSCFSVNCGPAHYPVNRNLIVKAVTVADFSSPTNGVSSTDLTTTPPESQTNYTSS